MKTFKDFISELFEPEAISTTGIKPEKEKDYGSYFLRVYKNNVNGKEVTTEISHDIYTNKSDIKFFVDGSVDKPNDLKKSDSFQIYNTVLKHINHHSQNTDEPIKGIQYSHSNDEIGFKKSKLYKAMGKKFNIPVEARVEED